MYVREKPDGNHCIKEQGGGPVHGSVELPLSDIGQSECSTPAALYPGQGCRGKGMYL